ncbi:nucleotide exchange factor GrpE [Gordonia jinhuaensis]|uniref:Protein GrpE n=1 Tax=Gordonia jinhuaensis TaxID=1517702 RepID=A0A916T913_9ACTN|nr:nucleotide exchange factor GrpE [Gordonia jinhuaensis]GGB36207.1 protein GrpE [Gordonia jinhuaensis]
MTSAQPGNDGATEPENGAAEPVTVTDRRRIDPETGEVRGGGADTAGAADEAQVSPEADEVEVVRAELTADLQRVQAEYANYRRRTANDKREGFESGKAAFISELLPVLDDLDRARAHGDLEAGPLKSVADKIAGVFGNQGVIAFGAEGDAFDPALHEAVQHEGDGSNPVIGSVYRQGYRLGDKVLRTAMVTVTDGVDEPAADSATSGQEN